MKCPLDGKKLHKVKVREYDDDLACPCCGTIGSKKDFKELKKSKKKFIKRIRKERL